MTKQSGIHCRSLRFSSGAIMVTLTAGVLLHFLTSFVAYYKLEKSEPGAGATDNLLNKNEVRSLSLPVLIAG